MGSKTRPTGAVPVGQSLQYRTMQRKMLRSRFLAALQSSQIFLYAGIVDAEEFSRTGDHVDIEMLSLASLLVHKKIDGVVYGAMLQNDAHNLE